MVDCAPFKGPERNLYRFSIAAAVRLRWIETQFWQQTSHGTMERSASQLCRPGHPFIYLWI